MLERLERLVGELAALHSKLVLLIGSPQSGKTSLLQSLAVKKGAMPLNIGWMLGARLAGIPQRQRHLQVNDIMRELVDQHAISDLLLLDNLEVLFDRTLQVDPLSLLKKHAHLRPVVAVWPGRLDAGRLTYAEMGHPERRDYGLEGLVPFAIQ